MKGFSSMLKEKSLVTSVASFRVKDKDNVLNFDFIKRIITNEIPDYGYRVTITLDELKTGGMLNSKTEKVLVVTNSEHLNDYYHYVFRLGKQGILTLYEVWLAGNSKLGNKDARAQQNFDNAVFSEKVVLNLAHKIHNRDADLDEEEKYYHIFEQDILPAIVK